MKKCNLKIHLKKLVTFFSALDISEVGQCHVELSRDRFHDQIGDPPPVFKCGKWIRDSESKTNMALDSSGGCIVIVYLYRYYGGFLKWWYPKMDGENNGKRFQNGWFGGTIIFGNIHVGFSTRSDGLYFSAAFFWRIPLTWTFGFSWAVGNESDEVNGAWRIIRISY